MWTTLSLTETQAANRLARYLLLALFAGLAWLVGSVARRRAHPHGRLISLLGWAVLAGVVAYVYTVRPVERWTIWLFAGVGFGVLLVWASGGGSAPKSGA